MGQGKRTCSPTSDHNGLPVRLIPFRLRPTSAKVLHPFAVSVRRFKFNALEPVAVANGDKGIEELFAKVFVTHDAVDALGTEGIAIVIGEHRHDGHP